MFTPQAWPVIETCGFDVLFDFLTGTSSGASVAERETRPFGNRGYAGLYTISFALCSSSHSDYSMVHIRLTI
jgi:hypothetical protein